MWAAACDGGRILDDRDERRARVYTKKKDDCTACTHFSGLYSLHTLFWIVQLHILFWIVQLHTFFWIVQLAHIFLDGTHRAVAYNGVTGQQDNRTMGQWDNRTMGQWDNGTMG